jgi:hypothetical protein
MLPRSTTIVEAAWPRTIELDANSSHFSACLAEFQQHKQILGPRRVTVVFSVSGQM